MQLKKKLLASWTFPVGNRHRWTILWDYNLYATLINPIYTHSVCSVSLENPDQYVSLSYNLRGHEDSLTEVHTAGGTKP